MRTYAFHDETGKIKKVISTTKGLDFIKLNLKDLQSIKVDPEVTTNSHKIIDGKPVKQEIIEPVKPVISIDSVPIITEKDIDDCKDIDGLKVLLKKMIGPKTISFGKGV
jgi:hypothetical protein